MAERKRESETESQRDDASASPDADAPAGTKPKQPPARQPDRPLPRWRVVLHNDDVNYMDDVVEAIVIITPLKEGEAKHKTRLAHQSGTAELLVTHRERAELYVQQFASKRLTATAEPVK